MTHIRRQIRDAAVTAVTGLTTTGTRVFKSRTLDIPTDQLPCLLVYTRNEQSELSATGGASAPLERAVDLVIVGVAQMAADVDDQLDTIAEEVEIAIAGTRTLGGLARETVLEETNQILSGEGEQEQGGLALTFTVQTRTPRNLPGTYV